MNYDDEDPDPPNFQRDALSRLLDRVQEERNAARVARDVLARVVDDVLRVYYERTGDTATLDLEMLGKRVAQSWDAAVQRGERAEAERDRLRGALEAITKLPWNDQAMRIARAALKGEP